MQVCVRPAMEWVASVLRTQESQCSVPRPATHMPFYMDLLNPEKCLRPVKLRHNSFATQLTIRPLTVWAADNVDEKAEYRVNFTQNVISRIL
jgi:hypothetical protein